MDNNETEMDIEYTISDRIHLGEVTYGVNGERRERFLVLVPDGIRRCDGCACRYTDRKGCTGFCFRFAPIGMNHFEECRTCSDNIKIVETRWMHNKRTERKRKRNI